VPGLSPLLGGSAQGRLGGQPARPRPGLVEPLDEVTLALDENGGHAQDAVADDLGLGFGERTVETCHLAPGQLRLLFQRSNVGQRLRTGGVGDGRGQMGEHDSGIMGMPGDPRLDHRFRHGLGQPAAIS